MKQAPLEPALVASRLRAAAALATLAAGPRQRADMTPRAVARRLREASRLARLATRLAAAAHGARRPASGA